jgi:histidinol-phosphate aminotransferase
MPIDMSINQGTHCSPKAIDVLQTFNTNTSLREYSDPENGELLEVIARVNDVRAENVCVENGSGPILRTLLYEIIRQRTQSSVSGVMKYLLFKKLSVPVITTKFTYKKIAPYAAKNGVPVEYIITSPEDGFSLDPADISDAINKQDSDPIVYIVNPNNPTGNIQLSHEQIKGLLDRHPDTLFWIDEVYYEYVDPTDYLSVASLVTRYDNLIVSRSMSFAYGLAGLRIGYFMADTKWVEIMKKQRTSYTIGDLQARMAKASFEDEEFLPWLREHTDKERGRLREALEAYDNIEVFPSQVNFLFCRFRDGRTSRPFADKLAEMGVLIKREEAHSGFRFDEFFRVSVGIPEENDRFIEILDEALGVYSDHEPLERKIQLVG